MTADKTASLDFDNWTAEDETAALEQIRKDLRPKFLLVEKSMAGKFPSGFILKTSLELPYEKFEEVVSSGQSGDQMEAVLKFLGQEEDIPELRKQSVVGVIAYAEKYFELWQKVAGTSVGESGGSSRS